MPDGSSWIEAPDEALVDAQTEQGLLGSLLAKPALLTCLPAPFSAEVFAVEWHPEIFEAIVARAGADHPVAVEVMHAIALNDPDRRSYIAGLVPAMLGTSAALIRDTAAALLDLYRRRRLVDLGAHLAATARRPADAHPVESAIAEAMLQLEEMNVGSATARRGVSLVEAADDALAAADRAAKGEDQGVRTGFASIDEALGPLEGGALYVLGARPGMGKSALALQVAINAARQGVSVGYISLEMQARQLGRRALAVTAGTPLGLLKSGRYGSADAEQIVRARREFSELPLTIEDEGGLSAVRIAMKARAIRRRQGLGLLIIDHLHIIAVDGHDARLGATWAIGKISNALKAMAKELDIPVVALSQLSRAAEGREDHRPSLADLRQSGEIEQDAEAVMLLHRPERYVAKSPPERREGERADKYQDRLGAWQAAVDETAGKAELILPKVRDGEPCSLTLRWNGPLTRFEEIA